MGDVGGLFLKKMLISELVAVGDNKEESAFCRKGFKGSRIRGVKWTAKEIREGCA